MRPFLVVTSNVINSTRGAVEDSASGPQTGLATACAMGIALTTPPTARTRQPVARGTGVLRRCARAGVRRGSNPRRPWLCRFEAPDRQVTLDTNSFIFSRSLCSFTG